MTGKSLTGVDIASRLDFKIAIAAVISTGIFLRFFHLGYSDYWHDEQITSMHIAGHCAEEYFQFLLAQPRQMSELVAYVAPLQNGFFQAWDCWGREQPEKAPLFYILEYFWACRFGSSVEAMRSLPALLSLLQLPAYYWFGIELFGSRTTAWLMAALIAVSPTAVVYAQEAREYSLYTAMIAFLCAAFLKATRTPSKRNWFRYGVTLIVSIYTSFLITFVIGAQLSFIVLRRQYDQLRSFALCNVVAGACLTPWVMVNAQHFTVGYYRLYWMGQPIDRLSWFTKLFSSCWKPLICPGNFFLHKYSPDQNAILGLAAFFYSLYRIIRVRSYPGPQLLLLILIVGSAPFVCVDLLSGGVRALILKYMTHIHVVVIAIVAYAFSVHTDWKGSWKRRLAWWLVLFALTICAVDSILWVNMSHMTFFRCMTVRQNLRVLIDTLNRDKRDSGVSPTIVIDPRRNNGMQMFTLSRYTDPSVTLITKRDLKLIDLPTDRDHFYLFNPDPAFLDAVKNSGIYEMKPVKRSEDCWLVRRQISPKAPTAL